MAGAGGSLTIVCSDCARNGKTLLAKLVCDLLTLRHGAPPVIFDTDAPDGSLAAHFPDATTIVDLNKTVEQVRVFDGIIGEPSGHFVVDLQAHHFRQFLTIYRDIAFGQAARDAGIDVTFYFLVDRSADSVEAAATLNRMVEGASFVPVRNGAIGDALDEPQTAHIYHALRFDREVMLPQLTPKGLGMIEHPDFHFDAFVAGRYEHFPYELKAELWEFLEVLYDQRGAADHETASAV